MKKPKPFLHPPLDPSKFATTKYHWDDLKHIIDNKLFPILRHVDQETTYRLYRQKLRQEWKSVYDFVLVTKFNFGKRLIRLEGNSNADDGQKKLNDRQDEHLMQSIYEYDYETIEKELPTLPKIPSPPKDHVWESYKLMSYENGDVGDDDEEGKEPHRLLAKNDFPYFMEDGIEHWCLWKLGSDDVNESDIQWAKDELKKSGDVLETMHWINPVHLKSLPDIDHAHIVCLMQQ